MKLHVINTGFFKLDGGAMFGMVPKTIWHKRYPSDNNNMCTWAMRCLLIEVADRLILIDTGIGDKQDERFLQHFYLHGEDTLEGSIKKAGFSPNEITDVILTHLHFDHCGGAVQLKNGKPALTFKNARYWSNASHWEWATNPNFKEANSFLKENLLPLQDSGHLFFLGGDGDFEQYGIDFLFMNGHTEKQMLPKIQYKDQTLVFVADLIPSLAHLPLRYIMAYDIRPMQTLSEKQDFLEEAVENDYILMFEHDQSVECCNLKYNGKGISAKETFNLSDI